MLDHKEEVMQGYAIRTIHWSGGSVTEHTKRIWFRDEVQEAPSI